MYALDIGAVIARSERCFKVDIILSANALQNIEYRLSLGKLNRDGAEHHSVRRQNIELCRVKIGEIIKYRCAVDRYRAVQLFARVNIRFIRLDRLGLAYRHGVCAVFVLLGTAAVGEICAIARFGCRLDLIGADDVRKNVRADLEAQRGFIAAGNGRSAQLFAVCIINARGKSVPFIFERDRKRRQKAEAFVAF